MAWFCKRCVDEGVIEKEWLEADSFGVVFQDLDENQLIIEICEGCGPGAFDRYGYPADCEEGCEIDPEQRIQDLVAQNDGLMATYQSLKSEMERYQETNNAYITSEEDFLREVKEIFEDILDGKNVPNTRLGILIDGYIRKIIEKI